MAGEVDAGTARTTPGRESWKESARLLRVMAHPVRLRILEALSKKSLCVKDLNCLVPLDQAHLSQHMAALRKAELVASHVDGPLRCYYVLRPTLVGRIIETLRLDHPAQPRDRLSVQREARGEEPPPR